MELPTTAPIPAPTALTAPTARHDASGPEAATPAAAAFDTPTTVSLLVFPGFSMMAFASTTEPLRAANLISGKTLYRFKIVSPDADDPISSSGVKLAADHRELSLPPADLLLVIISFDFIDTLKPSILPRLRNAAKDCKAIGGVCDGSLLLARAGLLEGYRCTGHWGRLREVRELHSATLTTNDVYCIDRDRWTCSGGTAAMDMMLALIRAQHGQTLAMKVADNFIHGRIRLPGETQPMEVRWRYGVKDRRLVKAIGFMEQSLETPMKLAEIADLVGLSARQMQRLFFAELGKSPEHFYVDMRLRLANELLEHTTDPVRHIALQCGFGDPSHFARAFQASFGCRPTDVRRAAEASKHHSS